MPLLLNSQYISVPSGTTAQRPASPSVGMMRFNTDINDYEVYKSSGWASLDADLAAFSGYNNQGHPHSIVNPGGTGLQGAGVSIGGAEAPSRGIAYSSTNDFGTHGGHSGSNSYPMYWAVHFNGARRAVNQLVVQIHANSWGYFRLEGSNNSGAGTNFATNGTWTALTFVSSNNGSNNQNMGGNSSGFSDGTIFTYNYSNNVAYAAYRIVILDSSRPNQAQGTLYQGSAGYFWRLSRV